MSSPTGRYRWNPQASCRTLDGKAFVLLDKRMVSLNEVGTFIWERLETGRSVSELVDELVGAFDASPAQAEADAGSFIESLVHERILVRC